jgi:NAD(P)-dependent dehydrogenase (short-subunit alcohol dehydrogenase family)
MLKGISGGTAVVTGAAGGIGAAVCRRLQAEGANVVAVDLDADALDKLAAELGGGVLTVAADVAEAADTERFFAAAVDRFGSVDMFHANAGIEGVVRAVTDLDVEDFDRVMRVNVRSVFLGAAAAARLMREQPGRGRILFTASLAAVMGNAGVAPYVASKHAIVGLMKSFAKEVGPLGIRVNSLCPGVVRTRMMDSLDVGLGEFAGVDAAAIQAALEAQVPVGRYGTPDEIAAAAAWLLSDEVPYMHGELVTVGGGLWP